MGQFLPSGNANLGNPRRAALPPPPNAYGIHTSAWILARRPSGAAPLTPALSPQKRGERELNH